MRLFTIIFSFTLLLSPLYAQEQARIQGSVTDVDGNPISFASVVLFSASDSSVAKTGFTTEKGQYILAPLQGGNYRLRILFAGMNTWDGDIIELAAGQQLKLETIAMKEKEATIDEVNITARKPLVEVKPDMTVFNVAGNAIAVGENAFELLRKAPGVMVDNNDNIILMGKSGVRIYIDGKPSPLSVADLAAMLKGMQSNQIESIEIITNPSAKYDAEGNAGIINIRLKKDQSLGTNGSIALGYAIGRFSKYDGSLTFNNRGKKVNFFGNYSGSYGRSYSFTEFLRTQGGQTFDQNTDRFNDYKNNNFKVGADYFLNKQSTIGVLVNGFMSNTDMRSESLTVIAPEGGQNVTSNLAGINEMVDDRDNVNANLNYGFRNDKGTTLNVDADYGLYRIKSNSFQPNVFFNPATNDTLAENIFSIITPTNIDIYSLKADYSQNAFKGKFSAGFKLAYIQTDNDFNFSNVIDGDPVLDLDRSNQFIYKENINAAYATYQRQIKKWNFELGLRAEQTRTTGELISVQNTGLDTVDREYLNFFPNAGLTYSPNRKHSFRINYSRRIDRPRYQDLNPFVNQLDQLTFQQGNPFLLPQYTHAVSLSHTFMYRYTTSLSYSRTSDFFTQITDTLNANASFITQENLSTREVISGNISAPIGITKWWSTYTNLNVSRTRNIGDFNLPGETGKDVDVARTTFNVYQQHTFQLPKNFSVELSGFYNSPSIWGANYLTEDFWGINAGAQVRMLDNKAILKMSVTDIFFSMQWAGRQEFGGLLFNARGGWESRQFKVNFTYNFGSDKVKASRRRKTGLSDETKRASGGGSGPGN